jgi:hypothetical protein
MGYASDGYEGGTMSDVAAMGKYQSQPKNKIKTDPVVKPETKEQYMARKDATRKDANRYGGDEDNLGDSQEGQAAVTAGPSPYQEVAAEITAKDLARQNRFRVEIYPPGQRPEKYIEMLIENASFPGQNLRTTPDSLRYGPQREIVHGVTYGPINLTFMCRPGLPEKVFFEAWHDLTFNRETWNVQYYQDYVGSIKMFQLDRPDRDRYMVTLHEVYPKTIISQDYNLSSNDSYQTLQVEFSYHHWDSEVMPYSVQAAEAWATAKGPSPYASPAAAAAAIKQSSSMDAIKAQVAQKIEAAMNHTDHRQAGGGADPMGSGLDFLNGVSDAQKAGFIKGEAGLVTEGLTSALAMAAGGASAKAAILFGASEAIGQAASWLGSGSTTPGELAVSFINAAYRTVPKTTANAAISSLFNIAARHVQTNASNISPQMMQQIYGGQVKTPSTNNRNR